MKITSRFYKAQTHVDAAPVIKTNRGLKAKHVIHVEQYIGTKKTIILLAKHPLRSKQTIRAKRTINTNSNQNKR